MVERGERYTVKKVPGFLFDGLAGLATQIQFPVTG
jgi:hypothetical protein